MAKAPKHSLHTFVHRTLLLRLIIAGLALAFVIGLGVILYERGRVSEEAIEYAVGRTQLFSARYDHLFVDPENLDHEAIRQAIDEFRQSRQRVQVGDFAYVGVFDTMQKSIMEIFNENYAHIAEVKKSSENFENLLSEKDPRHETIFINSTPHLKIILPLVNNGNETAVFVNAIFAFSPETIWDFRIRGIRAMLGVMAVVLLTTAVLYPVILRLTRRISDFSIMLLDANLEALETIGNAIAQRDSDTNAHNYRVSIYATRIGEKVNLPAQTMRTLIKGSFLHDVGKIGIPDHILHKPGKLDDDEFKVMKTHVDHGRQIIKRSKWLRDALEVVSCHHEKVEGKGYPRGIVGEDIPVTARIFAIADVFDALTSKRPYKEPWSFEQAMEIMDEGKGTHFDATLLETFSRIAKPLYDQFGGKEDVPRDELGEIIKKYFTEEMDSLEY